MSISMLILGAIYVVLSYKLPIPMLIASVLLCFFGMFAVSILSAYGVIIPFSAILALIAGTVVAAVRFATRPYKTRF